MKKLLLLCVISCLPIVLNAGGDSTIEKNQEFDAFYRKRTQDEDGVVNLNLLREHSGPCFCEGPALFALRGGVKIVTTTFDVLQKGYVIGTVILGSPVVNHHLKQD